MELSNTQTEEYVAFVNDFPQSFYSDIYTPWLIYLAAKKRNLLTRDQCVAIQSTYIKFPKVWQVIEVNFTDPTYSGLRADVERFIGALNVFDWLPEVQSSSSANVLNGLGVLPFLVWGAIAAAGALGIGGVVYSIGYIKEQNNQSELIRQVAAGSIPADVLQSDVDAENQSILGDVTGIVKYVVIGGLVLLAYKVVSQW